MLPGTSSALRPIVHVITVWVATCALPWPAQSGERPTNPAGGGDSITLEPVAKPSHGHIQRPVFVCRDGTTVTFADRPCGPVAEARELDVVEPGPGRVASTTRKSPTAATRPRVQPVESIATPAPGEGRCERLRRQLEALDDRMRAGYSAREAARLWNRWREVKAQLREARC